MYGLAGCAICVQPGCQVFPGLLLPAIISNTDHCLLTMGKAPCWQNTIARSAGVIHFLKFNLLFEWPALGFFL